MTEVKICGLTRAEDARLAESLGAAYLGVVFAPSPRRQDAPTARRIWESTGAQRVGVFVNAPATEVIEVADALDLSVIQLHGDERPEFCRRVRESGAWAVWKALRIGGEAGAAEPLARYAGEVDGILLEGHSRRGRGGVGAAFDWSRFEPRRSGWPTELRLILAGGLRPENVTAAIERVRPDVVDVSSGVERGLGRKDARALRKFMSAVRAAAVQGREG